ncbi:hypothetical protein CspHIS471_0207870 [Cutaneotrichosporon sp. HIS471]|nr:hypothetical protein CspHIS471_0207870 [Cutaneotrichosporon sp. HIS471]
MVDAAKAKEVQHDNIETLLSWLGTFKGFHNKLALKAADDAGRGLFAYSQSISSGEPILVIPAASLLNPLTLAKSALNSIPAHLFPAPATASPRRSPNGTAPLTTTQLLSLHLALTRDPLKRHKSEWQVFIDTLPEFRPLHPLTWVVPDTDNKAPDAFWPALEQCLSESVRIKIEAVRLRYEADRKLLRNVLAIEEPFKAQNLGSLISDETLLWAWLNVNTRTVSTPLGLAEPSSSRWTVNNHSFVPLLDMINHTSLPGTECPKPEPMPSTSVTKRGARAAARPGKQHLVPGKVDVVLFAPHRGLEDGEQVLFLYGAHSNATLFAEYGFTEIDLCVSPLTWPNDDIDVGPWVEVLWKQDGNDAKKEALQDAGMWDHNRLAANGGEPCPSVGLMTTLCVLASSDDAVFTPHNMHARNFSRPTKMAARRMLQRICESVLADAADCIEQLDEVAPSAGKDQEKVFAVSVVRGLLREEEVITRSILETLQGGSSIPGF